jgi:iron-sulfur cluster repair protein YtfE (RIC family)
MTDEQKITYALSCVSTHTPEEMLHMIINLELEDVTNIDKIVFHPTFPRELYETLDRMAIEMQKPMHEEVERVRAESERVRAEIKRVRAEIKRADDLIDDLRQTTRTVQNLNEVMEGQISMYQELNTQIG